VCDPWRSRATWRVITPRRWLGARDHPGRAKREAPPPLLADLDCAVRGPGARYSASAWGSLVTASPLHRGSACHRPKSHAPGTFALAARRAGCGRGNRRLARTRADGELRRGGRSPRHLDGVEPSHRIRSFRSRAVCRNRCAGRMDEGAGESAMKLQIVTSARPIAGTWHLLLALTGEPRQLLLPRAGRGWRWPLPGWANVPRRADLRTCTAAGCGGELDGMGDLGLPCPGSHGRYAVA
jgi:hypothetical protein